MFDGKLGVGEMVVRVPNTLRDTTLHWGSGQSAFLSYQLSQILKQNKQVDFVTIWYTILSLHSSIKLLLSFCRFDKVKIHVAIYDVLDVELEALCRAEAYYQQHCKQWAESLFLMSVDT